MNAIFYLVGFGFVMDVDWLLWMKHVWGLKAYTTEEEDHSFDTNLWW